jgi:cell wall-associated NlpC family hydrolase
MAEAEAPETGAESAEPTESNPDPELLRQAQVQTHNQKWQNVNWQAPRQVNGGHILSDAVAQLGQPHAWGGNQPGGFDSQGLVKYAYQQNGLPMSHMIHNQLQHGSPVDPGQLQPGDVVFVATSNPQIPDRSGVYAGSGVMVHSAPGAGVVASRISHIGKIVGTTHLDSVVRQGTEKPKPIPKELYQQDEDMPHNRQSPYLRNAITNVAKVHT